MTQKTIPHYGELKGHVEGLRFRTCAELKINEFTHSAYVGGDWVSERNQKLWDDNLVIATEYIGPVADSTPPDEDPGPEENPTDPNQMPNDSHQEPVIPNASNSSDGGGCFIDHLMVSN